ncbi:MULTISPECIES: hypothetical protein [unclassified Oerskovia]|uniref:hypothetical protein n=1 Tax=unclassified Oerskovia TaxID=2619021 RepID=UPI000A8EB43C|nr:MULTISPECIES: hypothetical protein [unclassified Oerskovia]
MSRAVAVPTLARSAALIVGGMSALALAQLFVVVALTLDGAATYGASSYGRSPDASGVAALLVLGGLVALSGLATFLVGLYRAVANVDRYLAFRVAVMPRRVEGAGTGGGLVLAQVGRGAQLLSPLR